MNTWFEHILFHTRTQPEAPAMVMEDRAVTYGMLGHAIEMCARRILALNLPRDAPVAIMIKNPVRDMTLSLALFRLGLPSISIIHRQAGLDGVRPSAVLGDGEASRFVGPGHRMVEVTDAWFGEAVPEAGLPPGFASPTDVCRLSLTSGSTGAPKLVTHRILDVAQRIENFQNQSWRAALCMPGLGASFGFTAACAPLATARTVAFAESPYQAIRMIDLFAFDAAVVSPEQLMALTRVVRKTGARVASLRIVWVAGGLLTRALLEMAAIYLCREIICRYGASETGVIADARAQEVLSDPGFAGHVVPGQEVGVFDPQGARCAAGQVGAVRIRRSGDATWIDIGDVGWLGADGRLYLLGRAVDVDPATTQARLISPTHEVEHLIRFEWDVTDAAAVLIEGSGAPPQVWVGVVDGKEISAEALATIARARGIAHPIRVFPVQTIPRGVNGKVNRAQLKAVLLAETGKAATGRTQ